MIRRENEGEGEKENHGPFHMFELINYGHIIYISLFRIMDIWLLPVLIVDTLQKYLNI